jgi:hypothetical protein
LGLAIAKFAICDHTPLPLKTMGAAARAPP